MEKFNSNVKCYFNNAIKIIKFKKFFDLRGSFSELYNKSDLLNNGVSDDFVQDNHSFSKFKGTLRGLHYQESPFEQSKLLRVMKGSIMDVVVDIRLNSPTFGYHECIELVSDNYELLYIDKGFAHGFITLEKNTEVFYKVSNFYNSKSEKTIYWLDDYLNINWKKKFNQIKISEKDKQGLKFKEIFLDYL